MLDLLLVAVLAGAPTSPCNGKEVQCVSTCQCSCKVEGNEREMACTLVRHEVERLEKADRECRKGDEECRGGKYWPLMVKVMQQDLGC